MILLYSLVETVNGMAISLGVGSSTFALVFYFMAIRDPSLRETGRVYQQVVYVVLRVAMVLILLTELTKGVLYVAAGMGFEELLAAGALLFTWTVIVVLFINPLLMTFHLIPTKFGAAIQAASWYTLGVMAALPVVTFAYLPLVLVYVGSIIAFAVIIEFIRQKLAANAPVQTVQ